MALFKGGWIINHTTALQATPHSHPLSEPSGFRGSPKLDLNDIFTDPLLMPNLGSRDVFISLK